MPKPKPPAIKTIAGLIPDERNANLGTERGLRMLEMETIDGFNEQTTDVH